MEALTGGVEDLSAPKRQPSRSSITHLRSLFSHNETLQTSVVRSKRSYRKVLYGGSVLGRRPIERSCIQLLSYREVLYGGPWSYREDQ